MKLKNVILPVLCVGLVGMTTGCNESKSKKKTAVVDTQSLKQSGKTIQESAENLALAGEQLVSPISFMYADIVFDLALKADPNNKRAQFFKAFLKPMMNMKGILNRIKPVVDTLSAEQQKEYNEFIAKAPISALKTFLLDGPQDIKTEEDALRYMDEDTASWEAIRVFMKNNKDLNLDINIMTLDGVENALRRATEKCIALESSSEVFEVDQSCDYLNALKVNISRADVEAMQHMAAGMQIYGILGSSYSLNGVRSFIDTNKDKKLSNKEIIDHFKNSTTAGKLRNSGLSKIPQMGVDAAAGARWALTAQAKLCPYGNTKNTNRPGFLFSKGLCIDEVDEEGTPTTDLIKRVETLLTGGMMTIEGEREDGSIVTAEIKPAAPLLNPIKDLRSITPISYNECDKPVRLADDTIGGLFPNKDGNSHLKDTGALDTCED